MKLIVRLIGLLAVLSLVAAACGSDDDTTTDEGGTTAPADDDSGADDDEAVEDEEPVEDEEEAMDDDAPAEMAVDVGVTDDEIRLGLITDLTGPFAGLTVPITDGIEGYWEWVNSNGGIAGRNVVLDIQDAAYDIDAFGQFYDQMSDDGDEGSVMLQMSLGSAMTASIREDLVDDEFAAIPLSWNSSWSGEDSGNIYEWGTNYCIESMNGIEWMAQNKDVTKVAVIGRAGDYGEDGSIGAKKAIEALGLELAYDGQGQVVPGADPTPVATAIAESDAELVWITGGAADLGGLMGRSAELGYTGLWAGNGPSYNQVLLASEALAGLIGASYTNFSPSPAMDPAQSAGMAEALDIFRETRPDAQYFGAYVFAYQMGEIARQGLEAAAANGDMTRQGVVDALGSVSVDLKGLASNITYDGNPNDVIPRESFVFSIDPAQYDPDATMGTGVPGNDGLIQVDAFTGEVAAGFEYEPCFGI